MTEGALRGLLHTLYDFGQKSVSVGPQYNEKADKLVESIVSQVVTHEQGMVKTAENLRDEISSLRDLYREKI